MNTLLTLLEGLALHVGWWLRALGAWRDPRAPMGARRAVVLLLGMPLFLVAQAIHAICLLLDELLFPRYRRVELGRALFITGIPRSGTTFLHRTLAADREGYTTLTTWEALLAPSILQRRLIAALAWLDGRLGGFGARSLRDLTRRSMGGLSDIHEVGLEAAEEDYLTLLPAGGCFILLLAFPAAQGLQRLGHLDARMPSGRRRRLLRFYRGCLQRHLYAGGSNRLLLSKNAAFGNWLAGLHEICPEARFMVCVREPLAALSSQISAISSARTLFGTAVDSEAFQRLFLDQFEDTLEQMAKTLRHWPADRVVILDMADLRANPAVLVSRALETLQQPVGAELAAHLAGLCGGSRSAHRHGVDNLALPAGELAHRLPTPYHRLLALPHRIRIPQ